MFDSILFDLDGTLWNAVPQVARSWTLGLEQLGIAREPITAQELFDAADSGKLEEAFGSGTAAVVSPVKKLDYEDQSAFINNGEIGSLTQRLYDTMTGMQWGKIADTKGWIVPVCQA